MSAEVMAMSGAGLVAAMAAQPLPASASEPVLDGGAADWKVEQIKHCLTCGDWLKWIPATLETCFCQYHQQRHAEMEEEAAEAAKFEAWHTWLDTAKAWADNYRHNQKRGSQADLLPVLR